MRRPRSAPVSRLRAVVGFAVLLVAGCAAPRIVPVLRVLTRSFAVERDGTTSPGA